MSLVIPYLDKNEHLFGFSINIPYHAFYGFWPPDFFAWDNYLHHLKFKCWNGELHAGDKTTLWRISKIPFSSFYNIRIFLLPSVIAVSGKLAFTGSTILRRRHIARSGPTEKPLTLDTITKYTKIKYYFLWIEQNTPRLLWTRSSEINIAPLIKQSS